MPTAVISGFAPGDTLAFIGLGQILTPDVSVTGVTLLPNNVLPLTTQDIFFDTSSLRLVVHSAAPVSVEVKERMIAWLGPILTEFYAGSEGNGFCVIDSPTWLRRKGSVGKPILGQVHICSDHGDELPAGQIGTVWFSGTRRFSYHNDHAKTAVV